MSSDHLLNCLNSRLLMIVLEHVSKEAWNGLESIHLVEEFDGEINALIPPNINKSNI